MQRRLNITLSIAVFQINMHSDKLEKLHEHFPPEILPEDFGGNLPKYTNTVSVAEDA